MNDGQAPVLQDVAILIVEDRYLIASDIAHEVERLGASVAGLASSVSQANAILDRTPIDVAVLDVNLEGEQVFPVADRLAREGSPFLFLTGYDDWLLPEKWRDRPTLAKPLSPRALRDAIVRLRALPH